MENRRRTIRHEVWTVGICAMLVVLGMSSTVSASDDRMARLAPLPQAPALNAELVELGRRLFFETRLSGDGSISCASCHSPVRGWSDSLPLSEGYPGTKYFRRTPSIMNTAFKVSLYWDGRMSGSDLPTLVRDHISEAHFLNADGRLVLERLRQIGYYEETFKRITGKEPHYGGILNAIAAFVRTINSQNVPFDKFLSGDPQALSEQAKRGYRLFVGKADCVRCHSGPMLSDDDFHATRVPDNETLFLEPLRHITFRRFLKTFGVSGYADYDHDPGLFAITNDPCDDRKFRTPSLRAVARNEFFMHNGVFASLGEVIEFYDQGGGDGSGLRPLELDDDEKQALVAFLESLSGDKVIVNVPELLEYDVRVLGEN